MRTRKHLTQTQRLYLLAVDTSARAFARLDREERTLGHRSWWTERMFYWHDRLHHELMCRLAERDTLRAELAEARAYISTIIDAPKDYPAEEGM